MLAKCLDGPTDIKIAGIQGLAKIGAMRCYLLTQVGRETPEYQPDDIDVLKVRKLARSHLIRALKDSSDRIHSIASEKGLLEIEQEMSWDSAH